MATVRRKRALAAIGATGLALTLALAGCSGSDAGDEAPASSAGDTAVAPAEENKAGRDSAGGSSNGGSSGETAPQPGSGGGAPIVTRDVIYTGTLTIRVADVDGTAEETIRLVEAAGGFVGADARSSDVNPDNTPFARASLTMRIPRDAFYTTVDAVAALGKQENRKIEAQDVTEEVVDLEARIATQRAQVESARKLLAKAGSLQDLVSLENELAKRQADLASLEAKRDRIKDLAALSTLTVELIQDTAPAAAAPDEPGTGFLAGLKGGWDSFLAFGAILLTVLGALLPWTLGLGVPLLAAVVLYRRFRRRRPTPVATPASAIPPVAAP